MTASELAEESLKLPPQPPITGLREQIRPALLGVFFLTVLTGVIYPLSLAALALPLFAHQADGGLIVAEDGKVIGAALIGQNFVEPGYFHPRPSAAGDGYDATASGGSNLSPMKLCDGVQGNGPTIIGVRQLIDDYRRDNGLAAQTPVPMDAVTRSGSGLDPHISPANAELQLPRVARQRHLSEDVVRRLVAEHTHGPQLGFLGEPRVAVLPLNRALDRLAPRSGSR